VSEGWWNATDRLSITIKNSTSSMLLC
jgi:hypothetical protein